MARRPPWKVALWTLVIGLVLAVAGAVVLALAVDDDSFGARSERYGEGAGRLVVIAAGVAYAIQYSRVRRDGE